MKRKKITMFLCCAAIGASVLTGCSEKNASPTTTETAAETIAETTAKTTAETTAETSAETPEETSAEIQSEEASETSQSADGVILDTTVAGWHIAVEQTMTDKSLENVSVALGYTGVETTDYVKEASDGNVFYLVKLLIEKEKSTEVIDWETFTLTDGEGNVYQRLDDEFLVDLGMMRMPGTKLNFGSNEGWIAYEIKEDASDLQLNYSFAEETFSCTLS